MAELCDIKGIGEKTLASLSKAGINTIDDLIRFYPRAYENRRIIYTAASAPMGVDVALSMNVEGVSFGFTGRGKRIIRVRAQSAGVKVTVVFFNQGYLKKFFESGGRFRFYGKLTLSNGTRYMFSPSYEKIGEEPPEDIVAKYPKTSLGESTLKKLIFRAIELCEAEGFRDTLPEDVRLENRLCPFETAIKNIHRPASDELLNSARQRLAFEELYKFSLDLIRLKTAADRKRIPPMNKVDISPFTSLLPYTLTSAQSKVISQLIGDLTQGKKEIPCMQRLIQGDVGCGKTVVAAAVAYFIMQNGGKAAVMAPTEILAAQHYEFMAPLFETLGFETFILTGSTSASERKLIQKKLTSSAPLMIIGTHALIEESVKIENLCLVITDEQQRFGVRQREKLLDKARLPNSIVMSATPIPRTLAMFVYGELDISVIDMLPAGRKPVKTFLVNESYRERMNGFVRKVVDSGKQVYIVCPLIEKNDDEEELRKSFLGEEPSEEKGLVSAVDYYKKLSEEIFPDIPTALLHGKQKGSEKQVVMADFASGKTKILVSTTVIEVGVNVPNACLMIVENAERFGMSQLHQLRGRIGRGDSESWCILVSQSKNRESLERLKRMCETSDGFKIAEYDLEMRGPGELFGERQHGEIKFTIANMATDISLFERARNAALKHTVK